MAKKKTASIALVGLAAIVAATQGEAGFAFVGSDEANKLAADGMIEIAPEGAVPNTPAGQVAARATQKGIDSLSAGSTAPAAAPAGKGEFVIEDNVAIPAVSGRGRIGSVYPFDKLAVGQSFFVPKAAKNLASTVSSANARYAEEIPGQTRTDRNGKVVPATKFTRHFIVRSVEGGSRIWRKA